MEYDIEHDGNVIDQSNWIDDVLKSNETYLSCLNKNTFGSETHLPGIVCILPVMLFKMNTYTNSNKQIKK